MRTFTLLLIFFLSFLAVPVFAHTPLLMLEEDGDGVLIVEGGFSTGAGAAGLDLYVKTKQDREILLHSKFPESNTIEIEIPQEPYYLVFDGGPGHKVVKDGPPPPGGFTINVDAASLPMEESDLHGIPVPMPVLIAVIIIAILLVIIIPRIKKTKNFE
jgi:hypothetical protein